MGTSGQCGCQGLLPFQHLLLGVKIRPLNLYFNMTVPSLSLKWYAVVPDLQFGSRSHCNAQPTPSQTVAEAYFEWLITYHRTHVFLFDFDENHLPDF